MVWASALVKTRVPVQVADALSTSTASNLRPSAMQLAVTTGTSLTTSTTTDIS